MMPTAMTTSHSITLKVPSMPCSKVSLTMREAATFLLVLLELSSAFVVLPLHVRNRFPPTIRLSSESKDDAHDSTITLGLTSDEAENKQFMDLLMNHTTLGMLDITVDSVVMSKDHFADQVDIVDVACFSSKEAVDEWLENIDAVVDDVIDHDEKTNGDVIAVCLSKDTASTCLQSERWQSGNIYYPQGENTEIGLWVDSCVQALGDVAERRFWGGGW